jgi:hypothetical protein
MIPRRVRPRIRRIACLIRFVVFLGLNRRFASDTQHLIADWDPYPGLAEGHSTKC